MTPIPKWLLNLNWQKIFEYDYANTPAMLHTFRVPASVVTHLKNSPKYKPVDPTNPEEDRHDTLALLVYLHSQLSLYRDMPFIPKGIHRDLIRKSTIDSIWLVLVAEGVHS